MTIRAGVPISRRRNPDGTYTWLDYEKRQCPAPQVAGNPIKCYNGVWYDHSGQVCVPSKKQDAMRTITLDAGYWESYEAARLAKEKATAQAKIDAEAREQQRLVETNRQNLADIMGAFEQRRVDEVLEGEPAEIVQEVARRLKQYPANAETAQLLLDTVRSEHAARRAFGRLPMGEIWKKPVAEIAKQIGGSVEYTRALVAEVSTAKSVENIFGI